VVLSEGAELKKAFKTVNKLLNSFDKMGFATDAYHGHLTVSPEHLGTGIAIEGRVAYKHKFDAVIPRTCSTSWTTASSSNSKTSLQT